MIRQSLTGLGFVASGRRNIVAGNQYESLYAKHQLIGTNPIIGGESSDTYTTLNKMAEIILATLVDTKKVAPTLVGRTIEETLRNCWNHVYRHFQYKIDAMGIEQIRRPSRSWMDRKEGIDCDCMSVVLSSLLHNLQPLLPTQRLHHALRKTEYNAETGWQHVYVVVPKPGVNINDFTGIKKIDRSKYYVLDCVVDKFDYEVPFIKKFDKVMKIQYLNGIDFATLNGGVTAALAATQTPKNVYELLSGFGCEFNGLNGLDAAPSAQVQTAFIRGLKQHLVNTRSIISLNPALTTGLYDPKTFSLRLTALIDAFDNPVTRNKVLGELAALEDREVLNGLGSTGLGRGFFKKIAAGVKKAAKATVTAIKKVVKVIVRYNPATIAVRNGLILAMKLNIFRMSEKLGYGYWSEEQAKAKGLEVSEWKKNKDVLERLRKIHKGLGGKVEKLDTAIKQGWSKGVKKHNLISGLSAAPAKPVSKVVQKVLAVRVNAASPLLKLVENELKPVNFKTVLPENNTQVGDFLQAVRTNKGGIATKLSLAYKPSDEARKYNKAEYAKYLKRVQAAERIVIARGGTAQQLRDAVDAGKKVQLTQQQLGEVATASTAAASGVLATVAALLKKVDFTAMFKGKATSPVADENEVKAADVRGDLDESDFDEGDPTITPSPLVNLLNEHTPTDSIAAKLASNPTVALVANLAPNKAKEVAAKLNSTQAAKLVQQIKADPKASTLVKSPLAQELNKKVAATIKASTPPKSSTVEIKLPNGKTAKVQVQDAQVIDSKPFEKDNTLKYVGIAAVSTLGLYALSRAFNDAQKSQAPQLGCAPTEESPAPSPSPMNGAGKKSKSSSRTAKVMAITI